MNKPQLAVQQVIGISTWPPHPEIRLGYDVHRHNRVIKDNIFYPFDYGFVMTSWHGFLLQK